MSLIVGVTLGVMYTSSAVVLDNVRVAIIVECDAVIEVSLYSSLVNFLTQKQNQFLLSKQLNDHTSAG